MTVLPDLTTALTLLLQPGAEPADGCTSPLPDRAGDEDRETPIRQRLIEISDGEPAGAERELLARLPRSFTTKTPPVLDELENHLRPSGGADAEVV